MDDAKGNRRKRTPPGRERRWLLVILFGFLALGTVYSAFTPPFEGPDEAQHVAYVEWLVRAGRFPPQGAAAWDTPVQQEAGQPPLYYLMAAVPAWLVGVDDPPAVYRPNPHFPGPLPHTLPDNDNKAIHYPADAHSLRGGWLALYLARGLSLLFGALLLVAVYGLAWEVRPAAPLLAPAAALLVAAIPQVLFLSGVASNDVPAAALSTVALWLLARLVRRGPTPGRATVTGIAFGLAVLTKASALLLALPLAAGVGWLWWSGRASGQRTLQTGGWMALATLAVAGWWFGLTWVRYGSPLGLAPHDQAPWAIRSAADLVAPGQRWLEVGRSFWIAFGWGTVRPPDWAYVPLLLFTLLAVVGLAVWVIRWRQHPRPGQRTTAALLALLALALVLLALFLEMWMRRVTAPHGRLLYPALGGVAVFLVLGWHTLHPRLPWLAIAPVAVLAVAAPFWLLRPAYSPPTPLTATELAALPEQIGWQYGPPSAPFAELLSVTPKTQRAMVGEVVPVQVCWRALSRPGQTLTVVLQLIGPEEQVVAGRHTIPGAGLYPAPAWQPGTAFCSRIHLALAATQVPRTLLYQVEVVLLDEDGQRLPVHTAQGNPVTASFADRMLVRTAPLETPTLAGDEAIQLLDHALNTPWHPGETHTFTLRWGVATAVSDDYHLFVHLRDPDTGANVAQADGPPLDGWYPTSWWPAGDVVVDTRTFPLPPATPAGTYDLVVGWYTYPAGARWGPEYNLGPIEVVP